MRKRKEHLILLMVIMLINMDQSVTAADTSYFFPALSSHEQLKSVGEPVGLVKTAPYPSVHIREHIKYVRSIPANEYSEPVLSILCWGWIIRQMSYFPLWPTSVQNQDRGNIAGQDAEADKEGEEARPELKAVYKDIKAILTKYDDVLLVLSMNPINALHDEMGDSICSNDNELEQFEQFTSSFSPWNEGGELLLIYNNNSTWFRDEGSPLMSMPGQGRLIKRYSASVKIPTPGVMIFGGGEWVCFSHLDRACKKDVFEANSWQSTIMSAESRYIPEITEWNWNARATKHQHLSYGLNNFARYSKFHFLFKRKLLQSWHLESTFYQAIIESNDFFREIVYESENSMPVFRYFRGEMEGFEYQDKPSLITKFGLNPGFNFDFYFGYHRYFNKGAALARTLSKMVKKGWLAGKRVLLISIGSEIRDTSMMTETMRFPFETEDDASRTGSSTLPFQVQFLGSILSDTDEEDCERPEVLLTQIYPSFKPFRTKGLGIAGVMGEVYQILQEWESKGLTE